MKKTLNTRTRYKIVGSDYSGQELRMAAFLSQDKDLIKAYKEGKDVYAIIASAIKDMPYEDCLEFYPEGTELEIDGKKVIAGRKTHINYEGKARRSLGKVMVLAGNYGMSAAGAGALMGKTAKEGGELLDKYFKMFSGLGNAIEESRAKLKKLGYVEDFIGRRRRLPDINLPAYEAIDRSTEKEKLDNFNPILGCEDRKDKSTVEIWQKIIDAFIVYSNKYKKDAKEADKNELSNTTFNKLQKIASNPKAMADKGWKDEKAPINKFKNPTCKDKIFAVSGQVLPMRPVFLQAYTGRIAQAERQCFNATIQGSSASLTKKAMVDIFRDEQLRKWQANLIITVHDEVLVECPAIYAEQVEKRLPEIMINAAKELGVSVNMSCDPYNVSRWYADTESAALQKEYKQILAKTKDSKVAMDTIVAEHTELPKEAIQKAIANNADLEF